MSKNMTIRFTPEAWMKLKRLCAVADTEIAGFGLILNPSEDLLVEEFHLVEQESSAASVKMTQDGIEDYYDDMLAQEYEPYQFGRVWIHTHPGRCPNPSHVDEETFKEVFESCHWAIMFILAKGGDTYCRLSMRVPGAPQFDLYLDCEIAWDVKSVLCDEESWKEELEDLVTQERTYYNALPSIYRGVEILDDEEDEEGKDSDLKDTIRCPCCQKVCKALGPLKNMGYCDACGFTFDEDDIEWWERQAEQEYIDGLQDLPDESVEGQLDLIDAMIDRQSEREAL